MNILVIGTDGFIGRKCVEYFYSTGHTIFGADICSKFSSHLYEYKVLDPDLPNYRSLFENDTLDICINASGSANVGFSFSNPERDFELNVRNVDNMLRGILEFNPTCKFINFSSAAVYGNPANLPIKETDSLIPLSPYGKHKLQSETLLRRYSQESNLKTCSLRIFSAYGPGLKKQLFWDLHKKADLNEIVELFGTGMESRDFIYIDDLMQAIEFVILHAPFKGECINVASGKESTIERVADIFLSYYSPNTKIAFNGRYKEGDPLNWRADISVLKTMGFQCKVGIAEGIKRYVEWLRKECA